MNAKNPLGLPGNLYQHISEVEILIETLNWINWDNHRRDILIELNLILRELNRIIGGLETRKAVPPIFIARLTVLSKNLDHFRRNVLVSLSEQTGRNAMEAVQEKLQSDFKKISENVMALLSKKSPFDKEIRKMILSYN